MAAMVSVSAAVAEPLPAELEEWPLAEFPEPSGIVYHPVRNTMFVVGDQGDIAEISTTGELLNRRNIGGDLEAVTCDPDSGMLYAVREGHEILFELRPDDFSIGRSFTIDRAFDGDANFLQRGGDGIEGLTFKPIKGHPEGGLFFAVNQFDPPVLIGLEVPLKTTSDRYGRAKIVRAHDVGSPPLSGVMWDSGSDNFLIVSALWRSVHVLDAEGRRLRSVSIPGFMQEGIATLPGGSFVIVQDTGGLLKWNPAGHPFADHGKQPRANEKVAAGNESARQ